MNKIFQTPLYPYQRSADQDAPSPVRHPVIIIGAGPIGLTLAADLALKNIPTIILDDNDKVSFGSRAVCISKRALEILDRLGCGERCVDRGVTWGIGKVLFHDREVFRFDLLPEEGHRRPAFVNLQQYYLEQFLVDHLGALRAQGHPVEIRGCQKLVGVKPAGDHVALEVETPDGRYTLEADWLIACDGANSPTRTMLGLGFAGRVFEDNFLIADVTIDMDLPTERRFWFDPPFNPGQSALMHRQPDNTWRIDLQLGQGVDKARETRRENVIPRLRQALGADVDFELEWVSVYTFQCRRMETFRHGRVLFAGDSAH
ncbi:MAG: FAD-dependent monooxygenase, partial [Alphaproteobacteria bacterium]